MRIGELARHADVSVETVRFYERRGLLKPPPRRQSGYRDYPPESLLCLHFIRHAQALGFSLSEVQELLALRSRPGPTCASIRRRVETKLDSVRQKIRSLERLRDTLSDLATTCESASSTSQCPTVAVLEDPEAR
jgi:MerR family mercuric resistance operon transcriptional regulator